MGTDGRTARLRVRDAGGRRAAGDALAAIGWREGDNGPIIADRVPADVLLVTPTARCCREAITAVIHGDVGAAVAYDHLDALGHALDALPAGCVVVSQSIAAMSAPLAELTDRELVVLEALAAGLPTADIAARLKVSVPTIKREVTVLQRHFDVPTPAALVSLGHKLGFGSENE